MEEGDQPLRKQKVEEATYPLLVSHLTEGEGDSSKSPMGGSVTCSAGPFLVSMAGNRSQRTPVRNNHCDRGRMVDSRFPSGHQLGRKA